MSPWKRQLSNIEPAEVLTYDWYLRLVALRKQGHFAAIYCDSGSWSLGTNPYAPWASREFYTVKELKALVEGLEGVPARKAPAVEERLAEFRLFPSGIGKREAA